MTRKQLEALGLEKEAIDRVLDLNGQETEALGAQLAAAKQEAQAVKAKLAERDEQLEGLKSATGDTKALQKQIEQLQGENKAKEEAHAAEVRQLKITAAVDAALTASRAKNPRAVKALLDLEKAELDGDGAVKGLKEQLAAIAKSDGYLFETGSRKPSVQGAAPAETGVEPLDAPADPSKMTYDEIAAYMAANPGAKL